MIRLVFVVFFALLLVGWTPEQKVYVCMGGSSYAYHFTRSCKGLAKCRSTIKLMPQSEAIQKHGRRPCGYCKKTV